MRLNSPFVNGVRFGSIPLLLAKWLFRLFRNLLGRGEFRYIILSLPVLKNQKIFDRHKNEIVRAKGRDLVDLRTIEQIFGSNTYSIAHLARVDEILTKYDTLVAANLTPLILDCGANIGASSLWFFRQWPLAKVVGVEPDPANIRQAHRNTDGLPIDFMEAAVSSDPGLGRILDPGMGNNAFRIQKDQLGETQLTTVKEMLANYPEDIFAPFIIKIDIEGFEAVLFEKNTDWIGKFPILIIELHDWLFPNSANSRNFLGAISSENRDFILFGENIISVRNPI